MKILLGLLLILQVHPLQATILACANRIEKVKKVKEKEGLGELGKAVCKNAKKKKARYIKESPWRCKTVEDYPCVDKKNLKMVQCDRDWECY